MRHCGQLASFLLAAPSWQAGVAPPWAPEPRHCGAESTSRLASGTHHRTQIRFVDACGARRDGQGTVSPSLRQTNAKGPPTGWPFCVCLADGMGGEKPRRGSTVLQEQNRTAAGWSRGATRIGIGCRDAPTIPSLRQIDEEAAQWAAFSFGCRESPQVLPD